jgi:hypothetical protein
VMSALAPISEGGRAPPIQPQADLSSSSSLSSSPDEAMIRARRALFSA